MSNITELFRAIITTLVNNLKIRYKYEQWPLTMPRWYTGAMHDSHFGAMKEHTREAQAHERAVHAYHEKLAHSPEMQPYHSVNYYYTNLSIRPIIIVISSVLYDCTTVLSRIQRYTSELTILNVM